MGRDTNCMAKDFICVAGYGWSGSSAVVDLLKEYDDVMEPNVEFRLIKDPYCLEDLRHQILHNWDALTVDTAIKDFLWYASCLNNTPIKSRFSLQSGGLDYERKIGDHFLPETYKFIDEITSYLYQSDWWMSHFKKTKFEIFSRKIRKIVRMQKKITPLMYFSLCTESEFDNAAKKYISSLFEKINEKKIVLDQAVPAQRPEVIPHFFQNAKMIIVDRDPRDIYVDLISGKNLIGLELSQSHDVNKYILWHKSYRQRINYIKSLPYVKVIQFEELVRQYDKVVNKIEDFLGLSDENHKSKKTLFNPLISVNNIGIWKKYPFQNELDAIEKQLSEYLIAE